MNCKGLEDLIFANPKGLEGWSLAKTATCRITSQSTHQPWASWCPFSFQHLLILILVPDLPIRLSQRDYRNPLSFSLIFFFGTFVIAKECPLMFHKCQPTSFAHSLKPRSCNFLALIFWPNMKKKIAFLLFDIAAN